MVNFGILGMNARNLQYIKKFNPLKAIRLADNKSKSKRFLSQRGIPVPETYAVIRNRKDLFDFDFSSLPNKEFIVKPNKGSRGRGIYRVGIVDDAKSKEYIPKSVASRTQWFNRTSPFPDQLYKISGAMIKDSTFRRYLVDILEGKNSLADSDTILLEELIIPGGGFETFCEYGLADIRVMVFNLIPVAAMLRVPTEASDGKANLDRGGIGMGVNVSTGKIYAMYQYGKIYKKDFPQKYAHFEGKVLPFWDDILQFSSKIQYFANLGYLALDRVITEDGPKILEINARAGLKFQLASLLPLRKRLEKIKDIVVTEPEKGVEIAKSLFSPQRAKKLSPSEILYLSQIGKVSMTVNGQEIQEDIIIDVDPQRNNNYLSKDLFDLYELSSSVKVLIPSNRIQFKDLIWHCLKRENTSRKIVLGKSSLSGYFIKPESKISTGIQLINEDKIYQREIDQLHILDERVHQLGVGLNLSRLLKPVNFLDELDNFVTRNGHYNPKFIYKRPSDQHLHEVHSQLVQLYAEFFEGELALRSPFAYLFKEKIESLLKKQELLVAYKKQKFSDIHVGNQALFGPMDPLLVQESKRVLFDVESDDELLGDFLNSHQIMKRTKQYVKQKGLKNIRVKFDPNMFGRMSVRRGVSRATISLSQGLTMRKLDLESNLAHEIDVHVMRWMNGSKTGWNILRSGTASFIKDEEGLAIIAGEQVLPEGYVRKGRWRKYYYLDIAQHKDFSALCGIIRGLLPKHTLRTAFNTALRVKKGISNTGIIHPGSVYFKDKVYLEGEKKVSQWLSSGGDRDKFMIGKIKIEDLDSIM